MFLFRLQTREVFLFPPFPFPSFPFTRKFLSKYTVSIVILVSNFIKGRAQGFLKRLQRGICCKRFLQRIILNNRCLQRKNYVNQFQMKSMKNKLNFLKSEKNDTFFQKIFILNNDIDLMANIIVHKSIISIQHHPYSHVDLFSSQYGSIVVVVT